MQPSEMKNDLVLKETELKVFSSSAVYQFLREESSQRFDEAFRALAQRFLDVYEYWPSEDEISFPDLYQ